MTNQAKPTEHHQPLTDALAYAKRQGIDGVDALISKESGFGVSARKGDVEEIEYHQEQGFSVTVYQGQRTGSASTTDLEHQSLCQTIDKAVSIARYTDEDEYAGLPDKALLAFEYPDCDLYHPWDLTPHQAAEIAIQCEAVARAYDKRITDSEGSAVSSYVGTYTYGNSLGFMGGYQSSRHTINCGVVARDGDEMQREYDYSCARDATQLLDPALIAKSAAEKTIQR